MAEISRPELWDLDLPTTCEITEFQQLSSYNWVEAASPTIVVPGSPALWAPPGRSARVQKDSGHVYIDQNAARNPESSLEPLFRALYTTRPCHDMLSTDVVTERNNLRKLLTFVEPSIEGRTPESFTIKVEIHKNTALFARVETCSEEYILPGEFRGFGREFEKVYTRHQIEGSTGHHRIVSYRFGGMSFIVRHETDGYVGGPMKPGLPSVDADELSDTLASLSLSPGPVLTDPYNAGSRLVIRREGQTVPLSSTLEIKTRTTQKHLSIQNIAAQIWLSQTPKLVRAYHRSGVFQEPSVEDVTAEIRTWQAENQVHLRKFAALIRKIIDLAKCYGNRATVRYVGLGDKLIVSPLGGKKLLPESLYLHWETKPKPCDALQLLVSDPGTDRHKPGFSVQVGTKTYKSVDLEEIPYFEASMKRSQGSGGGSRAVSKHDDIRFLDEVLLGLSRGFRQFFRLLPTRLSEYRDLCSTLKFLGVNVLQGRTMRHMMDDFRGAKDDLDYDGDGITGDKSPARDSAFRLLYMFLSDGLVSTVQDKGMAYNATFFVVSHPRIFRCRTRKMVLEAFSDRFGISYKQQKNLDKWPIRNTSGSGSSSDDRTTEDDKGARGYYYYSDSN